MGGLELDIDEKKKLNRIGASWFISYSYYSKIDKNHKNWENVKTVQYRTSRFRNSVEYHKKWLNAINNMDGNRLNRNTINLKAEEIKQMCKELIEVDK